MVFEYDVLSLEENHAFVMNLICFLIKNNFFDTDTLVSYRIFCFISLYVCQFELTIF